jgi:hypothetical protein
LWFVERELKFRHSEFERQRLMGEERPDLARKVRWVAEEDGDGAGYGIHSFAREPRMFELEPPLADAVRLSPHTYQASFG